MSNIVRSNNGNADKSPAIVSADPFQNMMREMMRWDPFREMMPNWMTPQVTSFSPAFEMKETKDAFLVKADLPGLKESEVDVKLNDHRLTISGKRNVENEDESDTYYTYERSYGSFMRTFTLPDGIDSDHIRADLRDGVLTVAIPKKAGAQVKSIAVKTSGKS